jgi:hypothetical protein
MIKILLPEKIIIDKHFKMKMSIAAIAKEYNVNWNTIAAIFDRNGLARNNKKTKLSTNEEKNAIKLYLEKNLTVKSTAKIFGIPYSVMRQLLFKYNIEVSNDRLIKNKYNLEFFRNESNEKYYFFGFSLGDGSIVKNGKGTSIQYTLTLKENDISVLENICNWISLPKETIKFYQGELTHFVRLVLGGDIWKEDWSDLGLVHRKTYNPSELKVPNEYIKPFLMGLIDADGSISFYKPKINIKFPNRKQQYEYNFSIIGHPYNIDWFIEQIRKLGFDGNINSQLIKGKWKRIRIQRKDDIIKLAKLLEIDKYYHLCLERKWKSLYETIYR